MPWPDPRVRRTLPFCALSRPWGLHLASVCCSVAASMTCCGHELRRFGQANGFFRPGCDREQETCCHVGGAALHHRQAMADPMQTGGPSLSVRKFIRPVSRLKVLLCSSLLRKS